MPHYLNRLTARTAAAAAKSGLYADGGGLYLRVRRGGAKSWCLRYMLDGKAREMGLGGLAKIGLADARKKAAAQRLLLVDKVDPLERREAENSAKKVEAARSVTFAQCAKSYIDSHNRMARRQACSAMGEYPRNVRLSRVRLRPCRGCRPRDGDESP